jgi:hypothetical protein
MDKKNGNRIWWWIVPAVVIVGGLGYYWYARTGPEAEKVLVAKEISPDRNQGGSGGIRGTGPGDASAPGPEMAKQAVSEALETDTSGAQTFAIDKAKGALASEVAAQGPIEELFVKTDSAPADRETAPDQGGYYTFINQQVLDFFQSLNTKTYFQRFNLEKEAYPYFAHIINRLSAKPPQPAGEGIDPTTLLTNIYFFARALDRKDLSVMKGVIENEYDTMEFTLETFYRWLMLGNDYPNLGEVRPPFEVTYRYAGFFLNTTGGRSYLFRRPLRLRLLVSYYCVLIVYQADRLGKNSYGINIVPYLQPLKNEIAHYPELEFQDQYISTLSRIENYYLKKR